MGSSAANANQLSCKSVGEHFWAKKPRLKSRGFVSRYLVFRVGQVLQPQRSEGSPLAGSLR